MAAAAGTGKCLLVTGPPVSHLLWILSSLPLVMHVCKYELDLVFPIEIDRTGRGQDHSHHKSL